MSHQILLGGSLQPDMNGDPMEVYTLWVDGQTEPERSREFVVHVRLADQTLRLTLERIRSGWQCRVTLPQGAQVEIDKADLPEDPEKKMARELLKLLKRHEGLLSSYDEGILTGMSGGKLGHLLMGMILESVRTEQAINKLLVGSVFGKEHEVDSTGPEKS